MAHADRDSFAHLAVDTSLTSAEILGHSPGHGGREIGASGVERSCPNFPHSHSLGRGAPGAEGDGNIWTKLHTETPPISVPRSNDYLANLPSDISYSHKPDDVRPSPLGSFFRSQRPSISFDPEVRFDSGRFRARDEQAPSKVDHRGGTYGRSQMRRSSLRQTHSQQDSGFADTPNFTFHATAEKNNIQRAFPTKPPRDGTLADPEEAFSVESETDRLASLTSVSTESPVIEGPQTPSEGPKGVLLSPLSTSPFVHRSASLDDPNFWSAAGATSWGNKSRSYTYDRSGSFKQAMRQGSLRSTGSSGRSPASTFLALWSSREELAPQPDEEGQMVGTEYVLGKQIGFGGFSTVKEAFKVEDDGGTKRLAVKIVKKYVTGKSERENDQVQAEFDHEVRIWRHLNHAQILALDAVYETDFATFCFTKLAIGGTLFDLIRANRSGLDMKLANKYAFQLASAIRYLHEDARVVHRDIKLENCLLDPGDSEDGTKTYNLVLCDFGMAEWMSTDNGNNSLDPYDSPADRPPPKNIGPSDSSTSVAGSLEYASPELLLSPGGLVDSAVDIWAYGVVVYAMVVGSRPFQHGFAPRLQTNIINGKWERDAVLAPNPTNRDRQDALELIEGCLQLDPNTRLTIRDALACRWLRESAENAQEASDDSVWKL